MFLNFNKFKRKSETFLQINVREKNTTVNLYIDNKLNENYSIIINEGYNNIIEKYSKNLNFLTVEKNNYSAIYQDALRFMKYIEFKILCYMELPTKIDNIKFFCDGPEFFTKAFENNFEYYLK